MDGEDIVTVKGHIPSEEVPKYKGKGGPLCDLAISRRESVLRAHEARIHRDLAEMENVPKPPKPKKKFSRPEVYERAKEYRQEHPEAEWRTVWVVVSNSYLNSESFRKAMVNEAYRQGEQISVRYKK